MTRAELDAAVMFPPHTRVRGKRVSLESHGHVIGSIPACAGETMALEVIKRVILVHPRVCGGNSTWG